MVDWEGFEPPASAMPRQRSYQTDLPALFIWNPRFFVKNLSLMGYFSINILRFHESFKARGHPNVTCLHKTTVMVTTENFLTSRGDCVLAIDSEKGLRDLSDDLKNAIKNDGSKVTFSLNAMGRSFVVEGRGDRRISLMHPSDMVIRKSSFVCDRTLMVKPDKAACDVDPSLVQSLKNYGGNLSITISVEL